MGQGRRAWGVRRGRALLHQGRNGGSNFYIESGATEQKKKIGPDEGKKSGAAVTKREMSAPRT